MAHAIWKGSISFGLVNIPISLTSVEDHQEIHFHFYDKNDKADVGYQYINKTTGKPLKRDQIVKGYPLENGKLIEISDQILKEIAGENDKTISIEGFVSADSIDYIDFATPYYLVPDKKAQHAYSVLQMALTKSNKVGIAKVIIHTAERLAAVIPYKNALVLNILRFHHELLTPEDVGIKTTHDKISSKEIQVAQQLIDSMEEEWQPESYKDEYQITLKAWLKAREKTAKPRVKMETKAKKSATGSMVEFMNLLKMSMKKKPRSSNKHPN